MFFSRLNKISGGCEKIVPVSESFGNDLKFLRMIHLTARIERVKCDGGYKLSELLSGRYGSADAVVNVVTVEFR